MEFPDLGKHCSEKSCKQLDYLPLNCAACNKVFCKAHVQLEQHKCSASYKKMASNPVWICLDKYPVDICHMVPYCHHICHGAQEKSHQKDVRVPVCPLCHVPVPVGRGETADVVVGQHMDKDCKYNPAGEKKIFVHRCSKEGCKKKEMFELLCDQCSDNFCIKHRHPLDHNCKHIDHPISRGGCAAIMRASESSGASNKLSSSWLAQRLRGKQKS